MSSPTPRPPGSAISLQHPLVCMLMEIARHYDEEREDEPPDDADQWLADHPAAGRELLLAVLADESLRYEGSPGEGWLPLLAAGFLADTRDPAVVTPMLELLIRLDVGDELAEALWDALYRMGPVIVEPTFAFVAAAPDEPLRRAVATAILGETGSKDERIFELLVDELSNNPIIASGQLCEFGDQRALPHLLRELDARSVIDPDDGHQPGDTFNEIAAAIVDLGGELSEVQLAKWERAQRLLRDSRDWGDMPEPAFYKLARMAPRSSQAVTFTRFVMTSADAPDDERAMTISPRAKG
ncbi:hypothetical protein [Haliangium sp.]|uniref:hypothetical protein n=1 Tax=Haliangium sp. TaxID=2663208 RepID=UPI003D098393